MKKYIGVKIIEAKPALSEKSAGTWPIGSEGYKVKYPDGYESWSPKGEFEKAYRETNGLTFGLAIEAIKLGKKVTNLEWEGIVMWIELCIPDKGSQATFPYISICFLEDGNISRMPWTASHNDILSDNWIVAHD